MEVSQDFSLASKHSASGLRMTSTELTAYAVISFIVVLWCHYKWNRRHFEKLASKMTGPPAYPIIGAGLEFVGTPQRKANDSKNNAERKITFLALFFLEVMERIIKLYDIYGSEPFKVWMGTSLGVTISKPEDVQVIIFRV